MNTALASVDDKQTAPRRGTWRAPAWLREPLLHFVVLGAALFGIDHVLAARADDPHRIVIDAAVDQHAIDTFRAARGHAPSEDELFALRRVWLDNEVLYREGLALGLDKGDSAIRERVIFKALSVVDAGVKLPKVEEATLRAWFERHREKYDEPARFDFEEGVLAGERSDGAVRAFVQGLNAGAPGDVEAGLRVFTARPRANIEQSYGESFVTALETAPAGEWQALPSRDGLRAIRLKAATPAKPADFDVVSAAVLQDWTDDVMSAQRSDAVRALAKKYRVDVAGSKP
jgi:parvulin-like peptidyl-prolyl cis-trans isomerase-like protein